MYLRGKREYVRRGTGRHEVEGMMMNGSRLLDALGLDMPSCEVILEYAYETVFRVFAQVGAAYDMQMTLVIFLRRGTRKKRAK